MPNTYKRLEEHDDISDGSTFSDAMNGFVRPSRFPWWDAAPWLLHLLLMIAYTVIIFTVLPTTNQCSPCFSGKSAVLSSGTA